MIKGTTSSGFSFKISDANLNDWNLLEALSELDDNPLAIVKAAKAMLGTTQYNDLKKHCTKRGHISTEMMNNELLEIMKSNSESKNS